MNTWQFLISAWTWNPGVLAAGAAALAGYVAAFRDRRRIGWLLAALGVFFFVLLSPLNALADGYLFSAHMAQHILLLLVAPALALLSLPRDFSLPKFLRPLANPCVGWASGVGAMWFWHAPALCNAAVASKPVYAVQTVSLLALGTMFWWQTLAPREAQRISPLAGVLYLFTACTACSVLGIILTFSPVTVCASYLHPTDRLGLLGLIREDWGMNLERDQQIGGLLMWVPMCLLYLSAIFAQFARWYGATPAPVQPVLKEKIS
ncbi:MAG: cytochrome c oxidase assembly protein [Verrucomicrobia bacterium]|nr:cytochrome c oxidase assembly protein [Verrucomicrobiota bacterium]